MRPTIGRWHTRYRVAGERREGVARIENSVRERVAESYAAGLEQLFGDDPAVYVLRRVQTELTVVNPSLADELAIARRWAERTCTAVVHTVTRHGDDASQVMRFEDTAAFVAQWIEDLLAGVASERWYYGAFAMYRGLSVEDAIRAALLEYREHLAAILRRLGARGRLPQLMTRISPESARELWHHAIRDEPREASDEQFRVFVRAAFTIADALAVWRGDRAPEPAVVSAYCATSPRSPDWKQPRALAEAVFAVLVFLERRGLVAIDRSRVPDVVKLQESVAAFEWLDAPWLTPAVEAWLREEAQPVAGARAPALTPLQQRIIDTLNKLLANGAVVLPDANPVAERNALALFAAFAVAEPQLASHPAVPSAIESLLRGVPSAKTANENTAGVRARATEISLASHPSPRSELAPLLQTSAPVPAAYTGTAAGHELVFPVAKRDGVVIESAYAGVFLLSRVLIEARIPQLAAAFGLPIASLLRALAMEWNADPLDAGIAFWSACDDDPEPLENAACEALRGEVLRLMRDRAAFAPSLAPDEDATTAPLASIASHLLRLWAHWLPGVAQSSVPWLLRQLILRPGIVAAGKSSIAVSLAPASLDVVLEMAGYLGAVERVPWLDDRRITFAIDRSLA